MRPGGSKELMACALRLSSVCSECQKDDTLSDKKRAWIQIIHTRKIVEAIKNHDALLAEKCKPEHYENN